MSDWSKQQLYVTGFGEQYNWFSLRKGLEEAKNSNKPLMLIIHKTWCGACKGSL
jgi:protein-disulfide reductase (glutathione)